MDPDISISDSGIIRDNDPLSDIVTASQQRDRDTCNVYTMWRCGGLIILPGSRMWTDCTDIKEAFTFPGHDTIGHCQELDSLDILAENALEVVQSVCCHHAIPVSSLVGQARPSQQNATVDCTIYFELNTSAQVV